MTTAGEPGAPSTLRERKHAATVAEIKEVALRQMAADSAAALSLRAVARDLGTSVQALYHYYPSRDALLTDLLADVHEDFVTALERVAKRYADRSPRERLLEVNLAYRKWARQHRERFLLIYGDPIPGFAAAHSGPAVAPAKRLGVLFGHLLFDDWPEPPPEAEDHYSPKLAATLADARAQLTPWLSPARYEYLMQAWSRLHGLVLLELHGHLPWLQPAAVAEEYVRNALNNLWDDLQARRGII